MVKIMNILAVEASGQVASVAVLNEACTVGEFTINNKINHSETLMPMLSQMLTLLGLSMADMDYIAVSSGPGSFTGLRIGGASAKALAHGSGKKIIPVPTLFALAYNVIGINNSLIVPIMDARRGQVYTAVFESVNGELIQLVEDTAVDFNELLETIKKLNKPAIFLGDGVFVYSKQILEASFEMAAKHLNTQRAASVAAAAFYLLEKGKAVGYNEFAPIYLRKPQAERELDERQTEHNTNSN